MERVHEAQIWANAGERLLVMLLMGGLVIALVSNLGIRIDVALEPLRAALGV